MLMPRDGGAPGHLVVLLHGYGSNGDDLIALAPHIQSVLPDALCVSPHAPTPCDIAPGGFQWFAIDYEGDRVANRQHGLPLARPVLVQFLEDLWAETGLGPDRTVLVGFSQGAMMALHVGTALADPLMGIVAFSGAFVPPEGFGPTTGKSPVCLVHGALDTVVDPSGSADAERALAAAGFDVVHHVSPDLAHGIDGAGLEAALGFIAQLSQRHDARI
jgi:phospholipase/carboxylesterase